MRNLSKAQEIVKNNLSSYGMIILASLATGLALGALSFIPSVGSLVMIVGSIFLIVMETSAIKAVAVDNRNPGFVEIFKEGFETFKNIWLDTAKSYLFMMLCLAPVFFIGIVTLVVPIIAGIVAGSTGSVVSGVMGTIILFLIFILVFLFLAIFFQYRLNYKVAGYVSGTDGKEVLKNSTGDIVKMTLILMLTMMLAIIPIIGTIACLLICIYLEFVYSTKVILDVNEGESITSSATSSSEVNLEE